MQNQVLATQKFNDLEIKLIKLDKDDLNLWFIGEDIGLALDLNEPRIAVHKIFQRHQDELAEFTTVTNLGFFAYPPKKENKRF